MTPNIDARNACYGKTPKAPCEGCLVLCADCYTDFDTAPKYDGNLLPAMTAMVTGFAVEQSVIRAEERARVFRETTGTFLPDMICRNADCGKVSSTLFSCHLCPECKDRCQECYDEHMDAGHESDSTNAQQRIHLVAKGAS